MKEEVRWLIGIGVILAGLILNAQRVHGNRMDRLEDALTEHRVEAALDFGEIKRSIEYLGTGPIGSHPRRPDQQLSEPARSAATRAAEVPAIFPNTAPAISPAPPG